MEKLHTFTIEDANLSSKEIAEIAFDSAMSYAMFYGLDTGYKIELDGKQVKEDGEIVYTFSMYKKEKQMKIYQVINNVFDYENSTQLVEGSFASLANAKAYKQELEDAYEVLRVESFNATDKDFTTAVEEYYEKYPKSYFSEFNESDFSILKAYFSEFNESDFSILTLELNDIKDDVIHKATLESFTQKELAGMYAICNKREAELQRKLNLLEQCFFLLPVSGGSCEKVLLKEDFDAIVDGKE